MLPNEEPYATPMRPSVIGRSPVRRASCRASSVARTANWATLPMERVFLRGQEAGTTKSDTGAPKRVFMFTNMSHSLRRTTALRPARMLFSMVAQSLPSPVTPPIPVMTTRRVIRGLR